MKNQIIHCLDLKFRTSCFTFVVVVISTRKEKRGCFMSQAFVNQRMRVAQRPTVLVHPSEEEEEEEEPTLPMDGYDYDEDDEEEEQEEEEEDEEEEEEEEEQEEDEEEERERGTLLLRVSNPMARKSVALKAPRKTAMKSSSYRASPSPQKQRQQKQKDDAEKRQKKKMGQRTRRQGVN